MWKIVAILKKRELCSRMEYSYVPSKWEKDGLVHWPKTNASVLRENADSEPQEDWLKYKCKVKKDNINGLEEAQLWEEEYVNATNTEAEESLTITNKTVAKQKKQNPVSIQNEYEVMFTTDENHLHQDGNYINFQQSEQLVVTESQPVEYVDNSHIQNQSLLENLVNEEFTNITMSYPVDDLIKLRQKTDEIDANQKKFESNMKRMTEKMDSNFLQIQATLDKIYSVLQQKKGIVNYVEEPTEEANQNVFNDKFSFPLDTVNSIFEFNKELRNNSNYMEFLIQKFSTVGGTGGNEDGKQVAKKNLTYYLQNRL